MPWANQTFSTVYRHPRGAFSFCGFLAPINNKLCTLSIPKREGTTAGIVPPFALSIGLVMARWTRAQGRPAEDLGERAAKRYLEPAAEAPGPSHLVTRRGSVPSSTSARCASLIASLSASSPRRTHIPRSSRVMPV